MTLLRSPIHSPIRSPIYSPLVGKWGDSDPLGSWLLNATYADYDARKLDRMFQESTGQTAVTASADKVGLWLDGSQFGGKTLAQLIAGQPELVANGALTVNSTGWTAVNSPTLSYGPTGVTITNNGATYGFIYQAITTVVGRFYRLELDIDFTGAGAARAEFSSAVPSSILSGLINVTSGAAEGRKSGYFRATATTTYVVIGNQNTSGSVNTFGNVSVKEVQGSHALNGTSTQRLNLLISDSRYTLTADGTDDNLLSTYLAGAGANSVIMDIDVPATLSASQVVLGMSGSATARLSLGINTSGQLCAGVGSDANTTIVGTTDWRGTRLIAALSADGSTVKLLSATGEEYSAAQNGSPTTTIPARLAANNNNGTASSFYGGGVARAIIAQKALDLATFNAIRAQLLAS